MIRILFTVIWLALSAWLLIWVGEGLFGVDQRASILPFGRAETLTAPIVVGVAWGLLLTLGGVSSVLRRRGLRGETEIGVGRIVEVARTGLVVNQAPQYDLYLRVTPRIEEDFVGRMRMLVDPAEVHELQVGLPLPVRYSPTDPDTVEMADPRDPAVIDAMLAWRIDRGLIDPRLVEARTTGTPAPASVLAVRPTGRRREGQIELALRVLLAPEDTASWEAETTAFVFPDVISRFDVGSPVWAFYRREDPQAVAVTLEKGPDR